MNAISYSTARQNLAKLMDRVCDEHETVIITRKTAKTVVLISLDEYNAMEETAHLLKSPANAQRLRASIKQFKDGKYSERKLIE